MEGKRKFRISLLVLLLTVWLSCGLAHADISVSLKLDRHEATIMDTVRLMVKVSGMRNSESRPVIEGLDDFRVLRGGTSSRVEIVNGKMKTGIEFVYGLQPQKAGIYSVGPAKLQVKGKTYQSETVKLTITEPQKASGNDRGSLFLNVSLSTAEVYLEEQTIYLLKLYRQMPVSNISLSLPESPQLTFQQLGKPFDYQSNYNDQTYQVLEVRYALTPTAAGIFGIGPARMNMTVIERRRRSAFNLFDDPFFSNALGQQKTVASEPLELKVLQLPEENRPADFSGLVGEFQIDSRLEPVTVKAGESTTLSVVLSGRGNIKRIPDLKMPEVDHIKVYADQPVLTTQIDEKGPQGVKTMKWALVPDQAGDYHLPPLQLSFFDTRARDYKKLKTAPLVLKVTPGKEPSLQKSPSPAQEKAPQTRAKKEVAALGQDILPVHTAMQNLTAESRFIAGGWTFWAILLLPMLGYLGIRLGFVMRQQSPASIAAAKARKASKMLLRECSRAEIDSKRLVEAWKNYLNDRFGLKLGSLTAREAFGILNDKGVSRSTAQKVFELIQSLEDAVYSGQENQKRASGQDFPRLVKQVEKEIR